MGEMDNLYAVLPELVVVVGAMLMLMLGAFGSDQGDGKSDDTMGWLGALVLAVAAALVILQPVETMTVFDDALVVDPFARFMKVLVLLGAIFSLFLSFDFLHGKGLSKFEYPVLILLATSGMMLMISATDLISLYLALELQSLSLYVLAAFHRDNLRSTEAGLKYFVLGALSSGMLLYGASLVYGFSGSTSFAHIGTMKAITADGVSAGLVFGVVFVLVGLAFKVSAVPFHMWTPDVYEGAPTPVTAFFAAAPKLAAMALLMRVLGGAFHNLSDQWQQIIYFAAAASMVLGAFAAIGQTNIKRLMAFSSIGHVGYALVGLAAADQGGAQATLVYLTIYLVMTLGVFACILAMRRQDVMVEEIDELSGLAQNNLPMAFALSVLMFSLAGLPPLAGFAGKLMVFSAAVDAKLYVLAIIGVLSSVVAAYYYLRIVKVMFFDDAAEKFSPIHGRLGFVMVLSVVFVFGFMIVPSPLVGMATEAALSLKFVP